MATDSGGELRIGSGSKRDNKQQRTCRGEIPKFKLGKSERVHQQKHSPLVDVALISHSDDLRLPGGFLKFGFRPSSFHFLMHCNIQCVMGKLGIEGSELYRKVQLTACGKAHGS